MPSYYDLQILSFTNQVTESDFRQAWILWEKNSGSLRHRWVKVFVAAVLLLFVCLMMPRYSAVYTTSFVPVCAFAALNGYLLYQIFVKIRMVGDEADRMYGSNRLLRQEENITLTREGFTIQNAYESIQGYWAEAAQCFETESFFAVAGGSERPLLILSKESIPSQRREEVSGKMKSIFAARYRRISR